MQNKKLKNYKAILISDTEEKHRIEKLESIKSQSSNSTYIKIDILSDELNKLGEDISNIIQELKNDQEAKLLLLFDAHGKYNNNESYISFNNKLYSFKDLYTKINNILVNNNFIGNIFCIHTQCKVGGLKNITKNKEAKYDLKIGFMSSKKDKTLRMNGMIIIEEALENFNFKGDFDINLISSTLKGINFNIIKLNPTMNTYTKNKYLLNEINEIMNILNIPDGSEFILNNDDKIAAITENDKIKLIQQLLIGKIENSLKRINSTLTRDDIKKEVEREIACIHDVELLLLNACKELQLIIKNRTINNVYLRKDFNLGDNALKLLEKNIAQVILKDIYLKIKNPLEFLYNNFNTLKPLLKILKDIKNISSDNLKILLENSENIIKLHNECPEILDTIINIENISSDNLKILLENLEILDTIIHIENTSSDNLKILFENSENIINKYPEIINTIIFNIKNISSDNLKILFENSENIIKLHNECPEILDTIIINIKNISSDNLKILLENSENIIKLHNECPEILDTIILNIENIYSDKLKILFKNSENIINKYPEIINTIIFNIKNISNDNLKILFKNSENIIKLHNECPEILDTIILNIENISSDKLKILFKNSENIINKYPEILDTIILNIENISSDKLKIFLQNKSTLNQNELTQDTQQQQKL